MRIVSRVVLLAFALVSCSSGTNGQSSGSTSSTWPDAKALAAASADDNNWMLPGKTYANNRYTGLTQVTAQNVGQLSKAWSTEIADNGQQESSLLVWNGTTYFSTPHDNVIAVDAATGKLKWQFPYNPAYSLVYTVSRGIGLADGKVFLATLDCRVVAIDATNGKKIWDVNGCPNDAYTSTANALFSMASYVYGNEIILGTAGGDNGNIGHVMAFSTQDGHRIWDWQNIPAPGQPGHNTWPGNSWQHGGGDTWGGITIDPSTQTLFISVGNPGPDMVDTYRKGENLYTDSVLALDMSGTTPKPRWYYKILRNDTHDADPAMPPVLFDAKVGSTTRPMLAVGDKAGDFVVLDRSNGKVVYRMVLRPADRTVDTANDARDIRVPEPRRRRRMERRLIRSRHESILDSEYARMRDVETRHHRSEVRSRPAVYRRPATQATKCDGPHHGN